MGWRKDLLLIKIVNNDKIKGLTNLSKFLCFKFNILKFN